MMANYYEKLTKIFLMSGNALYHAAAWSRYHAIVTSIGGKSEEEMAKLAGQVLVSALAVPVGLQGDDLDSKAKSSRLTALLGLTKAPTRAGLLKDAVCIFVISSPNIRLPIHSFPVTSCVFPPNPSRLCTRSLKPPLTHSHSAHPLPRFLQNCALQAHCILATAPS